VLSSLASWIGAWIG